MASVSTHVLDNARGRPATGVPVTLFRVSEAGLAHADQLNVDAGLMKPEDKVQSYDGLYTAEFVK